MNSDLGENSSAKDDIKKTSEIYQWLFENTFDGFAYCKMIYSEANEPIDFTYLEVNKKFETLTGLKNVVNKKVTEVIPGIKESNNELFITYGRVALTGKAERFESYVKQLNIWFEISVYCPQKGYFIALIQDITSMKNEAAKYAILLENIGEGIIAVDKDRKVLFLNKNGAQIFDWKVEDVVNKKLDQLPLVDDDGKLIREVDHPTYIATHKGITVINNSYYFLRPDNTKVPLGIVAAPIKLKEEINGAVVVFRDITSEKEIDRAKTEFVSLASHQLKTPLGVAKWYLEAIKNGDYIEKSPKVTKEYVEEIYKSNDRSLKLVQNLLSVSRIDQGRMRDNPKPTSVIDLITGILGELKIVALTKNITIELTTKSQDIPNINIDAVRLREVIENLISNAIEYNVPSGKVTIIVEQDDHKMIKISIKDTGIGLDDDDLKKLFSKFFRTSNGIIANANGSGLGLYIVKSYVEAWGGEVTVQSKKNEGSTFTITIPVTPKQNET